MIERISVVFPAPLRPHHGAFRDVHRKRPSASDVAATDA
jgi:hypothetical protein